MSTYETHLWENPELPFIFHRTQTKVPHRLGGGNWHENVEIIFALAGEGEVLNDGVQIRLMPGEASVINSNAIHDVATAAGFTYYYLIVDRSFCLANYFDTNRITFRTERIVDPYLTECFTRLGEEYEKDPASPFRTQKIRALILSVMAHLCTAYCRTGGTRTDSRLQSSVKQAIGYIRSHLDSPDLSLDEITQAVGISKYYFVRKFQQITGYTCVNYINLMRCEKAKKLLAEGRLDAGEVGKLCGFNSHSYFSNVFRGITGVSPKEFRAVQAQKEDGEEG